MSPEMVNEMTYDERSDIWALGCLLYEMATLAYVRALLVGWDGCTQRRQRVR